MIIVKTFCGSCGDEMGKFAIYDMKGNDLEAYGQCKKCTIELEPDIANEDADPDNKKEL